MANSRVVSLGSDGRYWVRGYTPPSLSPAQVVSTAETTATLSCVTDRDGGTIYVFVSLSTTAPSVTDLKAGTGATYASSKTATGTTETFNATGLTSGTTYQHYWLQTYDGRDSGIYSNTVATADPAPGVGDHDLTLLPLDANGWHDLAAMVQTSGKYDNSRIVYVSTSGNDANAAAANGGLGYYTKGHATVGSNPFSPSGAVVAYRKASTAFAKLRNNQADIMLFKRGDTFDAASSTDWGTSYLNITQSGISRDERMIIASYGSGALPVIQVSTGRMAFGNQEDNSNPLTYWGSSYWIIAHLDFYSPHQDTTQYVTYGSFPGYEEDTGIEFNRYGFHCLVEGCKFRYCRFDWNTRGGTSNQGTRDWPRSEYCMVRRCFINESYCAAGGTDVGVPPLHESIPNGGTGNEDHINHAQAMHSGNHFQLAVEECVMDQGGWSYHLSHNIDTVYGHPTLFRHNLYLSQGKNAYNYIIRNNIFSRGSSVGCQQRPGGLKYNNLFLHNPIASNHSSYWDNEVSYNVVLGSLNQNFSDYYNGGNGWGIGTSAPGTTEVHHNITTQVNAHGVAVGTSQRAYSVKQANYQDGIPPVTSVTYSFHDNIAYKWNGEGFLSEGGSEGLAETEIVSLSFTNNDFVECDYFISWNQTITDKSKYTFSGNRYKTYSQTQPFYFSGKKTLAEWQAYSGDTSTIVTGSLGYPDPDRDIETYLTSIVAPESAWEEFIARALDNDITNWDSAYTAAEVNSYIRAGFGMSDPA